MEAVSFSMTGKVALITGAGRGIGKAIAQAFAAAGAAVAISDVDEAVAREAVREIENAGGRAVAFGGDITDLALPQRLIEQTVGALGGLHVLVNNAAVQTEKQWLDLTPEEIQRDLNGDLASPILFCQHAARIFKPQRYGRIINIGSILMRKGHPYLLPYSLAKAGLQKLTTALVRPLAADGITINTLAPGWFNTYRNRHDLAKPGRIEEASKGIPLGRLGEPRDCAGAALLLCSDAGQYITGQTIFVDGGMGS